MKKDCRYDEGRENDDDERWQNQWPLDKDMTMSNGTMVMMDGTVKMKDGKTMMMKEGDKMTMDGKMTKMKKPMQGKM